MNIEYFSDRQITVDQFVTLLKKTTLGGRRPVENPACMSAMLEHADLLVTAWLGNELVGVARSVTDFHFCCYLSDLAVSNDHQGQGIGTGLVQGTLERLQPGCLLTLLSAPQAVNYYPKIGFEKHESSWFMFKQS